MTYTAENVREMREWLDAQSHVASAFSHRRIAAMLTAYADRLEQDEQTLKEGDIFTVESTYVVNPPFSERELGRREVYREIAAMDPMVFEELGVACPACGRGKNHAPDCLWLRATSALRETTPTP